MKLKPEQAIDESISGLVGLNLQKWKIGKNSSPFFGTKLFP
jgi:hypothetical protein